MNDLEQDQGRIPETGNRPDYLNRLKARQQDNQNIAPISVNTETGDAADGQQSYSDSAAEALQNLFQQLFSSKFNLQLPVNGHSLQAERPFVQQVFTAPKGQTVVFAEDITGGVKGITDSNSYLFITRDDDDVGQEARLRAYIVPKDNPSKQHEVSLTNTEITGFTQGTGKTDQGHEYINGFRATLGQGHELVVKASGLEGRDGGAWLDGKQVRTIDDEYDRNEWHLLLGERMWICLPSFDLVDSSVHPEGGISNEGISEAAFMTGPSVTLLQKDYETGRILKFTQSGTSNLGRVEVIQGEPRNTHWMGEVDRPPISSHDGVALPKEMRDQAVYEERCTLALGRWFGDSDSPENRQQLNSLNSLIGPSDRQELEQKEKEWRDREDKLYSGNKQGPPPTGRTWPVP